ncbi:hypothetical protein PT229_01010 [Erysipelothrix rhusiopathiae]|uniref:hypothetical protein n=1 Tax=Erysipelothrix rhusiopathiae TaxID=1648 RepID=UPI0023AF8FB1|nr:hypothetical protein [Erysipelothrix rhusiopathiae]MDE8333903.1 hypothetical protein [Erysipelothrix rhusiopathiae]
MQMYRLKRIFCGIAMLVTIVLLMLSIFTLILVSENRSLINDIKIRTNNLLEEQTNMLKKIEIMKNSQASILENTTTYNPK